MGTITRALANNITTGGVVSASGISNTSVSAVTLLPSSAVGDFVLISEQSASASASLSFTSGLDSTYDEYWFIFNNIHPATDNVLFQMNGSTDGGSNYNVTKTTTVFEAYHNEGDTEAALSYSSSLDIAQGTGYQQIAPNIGNGADESTSGILKLYNPSSTTYVKHFIVMGQGYNYSDYSEIKYVAGYFNTTSAIDAIDFKMSSGNIDDGTIKLFGIKKT